VGESVCGKTEGDASEKRGLKKDQRRPRMALTGREAGGAQNADLLRVGGKGGTGIYYS